MFDIIAQGWKAVAHNRHSVLDYTGARVSIAVGVLCCWSRQSTRDNHDSRHLCQQNLNKCCEFQWYVLLIKCMAMWLYGIRSCQETTNKVIMKMKKWLQCIHFHWRAIGWTIDGITTSTNTVLVSVDFSKLNEVLVIYWFLCTCMLYEYTSYPSQFLNLEKLTLWDQWQWPMLLL